MKIENIKINTYGNLEEKEIALKSGINIIYGKNESGKSTFLSYLTSMFYGISKLKENKEISDYDKYKPWKDGEFSGKIDYVLDNGKKYEIFRDFNKKSPKIFNENKEDITNSFNTNKKEGSLFFEEQTGIDKDLYLSTIVASQGNLRLSKEKENSLVNKIANLAGTGEDNVSYSKALKKLSSKMLEEVGNERTKGKPINVVNEKIEEVSKKLEDIKPFEEDKYEIDNKKEEKINEIATQKRKVSFLEEIGETKEKAFKVKNIIKENIDKQRENDNKIDDQLNIKKNLEKKKDEKTIFYTKEKDVKKKFDYKNIIPLIVIAIAIILAITINQIAIKIISIIVVILSLAYLIYGSKKNKDTNKIKFNVTDDINNIEDIKIEISKAEGLISYLEEENAKIELENTKLEEKLKELNPEIEEIRAKYTSIIDNDYMRNIFEKDSIKEEYEKNIKELNDLEVFLRKIELEEENAIPILEKKPELEEEYERLKEEKEELLKKAEEIGLAKEILENSYTEMKSMVTPKFTENLSENINRITNGKYKKVIINDEKGLIIEKENGDYTDLNYLSYGTIDELYLSLRLCMIEDLSDEKMPIILDEPFAYFDEERIEKTLKYLAENLKENQKIIFTCTNREKEILEKENIEFNLIELK